MLKSAPLCLFALAFAALVLAAPAAAQDYAVLQEEIDRAALTASFACVVDIANNFDDCFDPVTVSPLTPAANQRQVQIDLNNGFNWRSLTFRYEVCNGTGWTWNIADSPTNNGFGGDAGSTQHDAEAQAFNNNLGVYRSDIGNGGLTCQFPGPQNPQGCIVQQVLVRNDYLEFDSAVAFPGANNICSNVFTFDFPGYDEADAEDPTGLYEDKLYVGLNRSYASSSRSGSGVQRACFFLSTSAVPNAATVDAECGF